METSSKEDTTSDGDTSSRDTPPSNSTVFSEGERVLAYHGPRIYEAKVQKAELRKKEWRYYVHYLGWSKNWDEWVGAERLMKHTEENVLKQQALEKKLGVDKSSKAGRSAQTKRKSSTDVKMDKEELKSNAAKGKRRKNDSGVEVTYEKGPNVQETGTAEPSLQSLGPSKALGQPSSKTASKAATGSSSQTETAATSQIWAVKYKTVGRKGSVKNATPQRQPPSQISPVPGRSSSGQPGTVDKGKGIVELLSKRQNTKGKEPVTEGSHDEQPQEVDAGEYFSDLLDRLPSLLRADKPDVYQGHIRDEQLVGYSARHVVLAALGLMKMFKDFPELAKEKASLEEANRKLEGDNRQIKSELESFRREAEKAKKVTHEFEMKLRGAREQRDKAKEALTRKVKLRDITASLLDKAIEDNKKLKQEVDFPKMENSSLRQDVNSDNKRAEIAEKKVELVLRDFDTMKSNLARAKESLRQAETRIKEEQSKVEARVKQAWNDATDKTSSSFLFTLWEHHPEMDFSFFGKEAVEEVKKYVARVAKAARVAQKKIPPLVPKKGPIHSAAQADASLAPLKGPVPSFAPGTTPSASLRSTATPAQGGSSSGSQGVPDASLKEAPSERGSNKAPVGPS